jgi:hypothetical protein
MSLDRLNSGSDHAAYLNPAEQVTTLGGRLAALMLANQQGEQEAEQDLVQLAREQFKQALAEEVAAMHEAADDMFVGALVQGGISLASGALTVSGAFSRDVPEALGNDAPLAQQRQYEIDVQCALQKTDAEVMGEAIGPLGAPIAAHVSNANGDHARADAKQHGGEGEQSRWAMNDARDRIRDSKELGSQTRAWLRSLTEQEAAATAAVLANMA